MSRLIHNLNRLQTFTQFARTMKLALHLQQELIELGLQDVNVTKHAVVTAYLPSNHPDLTQTNRFYFPLRYLTTM